MRIDQLELTNFRCFEHRAFTFSPGFNVLVGENGTGKTAVLDAIALGLGPFVEGFTSALPRARTKLPDSDARFVVHESGEAINVETQWPVALDFVATYQQQWTWRRAFQADGEVSSPDWNSPPNVQGIARRVQAGVAAGTPIDLPVLAYYRASRLWLDPTVTKDETIAPGSRARGYESWDSSDARATKLTTWFKTQELIAWQEKTEPRLLAVVRDAIKGCIELCTDVRFVARYDELMLRFGDERWVPFRLLSDGLRNMCALVGDLAYRCAELNPHLGAEATRETSGAVLIDEIDLHLHPRWQRAVVEDLRRTFPKVQFFATTHSPFIIQSLREGELVVLDEREPHPYVNRSIEDISEEIMGIDEPQRSERFQQMIDAAKDYYRKLDAIRAHGGDEGRAKTLKAELDRLLEPFRDDPAYVAYLEYRREASGVDDAPSAISDAAG